MEQKAPNSGDREDDGQLSELGTGFDEPQSRFLIATHRCQTVINYQARSCDSKSEKDFAFISSDVEAEPQGEVFKCYSAKCQICLELDKDKFQVQMYTMLQNLADSAARGCLTCDILLQGIQKCVKALRNSNADIPAALSPYTLVKIELQDGGPVSIELSGPIESWDAYSPGEKFVNLHFYSSKGAEAALISQSKSSTNFDRSRASSACFQPGP